MDIKRFQKVLVRNMLRIAKDAQKLKGGDQKEAVDDAIKQLHAEYKEESVQDDIDMDNIDWSKVKVIKENE
jgi:hypothetical protein